ncbi:MULTISPECIES: hypothetical protein [Pseudomonas]|uniref:Uncharacterized protein n=1 Tax=Pseudomonas citronellolis TaxID=53408 RepID=A0A1A9KGT1_9PSED|nr:MULTISPECIES: hypothetical protein [Pseudomonas]ANI16203.1 hypothetical protein A9C11_20465 [Pseudomonas citronellolis]EJU9614767.1 hypothetical protein [Pseudomonas aeruginosa]EKU2928130.1 hypothetical protein [Pseudomonas aeruginosa]ELM0225329.1 hypothetical protein [Pseudomonas aeruginosa]MCS9398851.1 hypothetical protein [Pseudomonas aeruginosa]
MSDPSLRLRPLVSLLLFLSAYSPLMVILAIKDLDLSSPWFFHTPINSGILLLMAVGSSVITLRAVKEIDGGLPVVITKAANKSGDMFGYTIPYMLSFMRIDLGDWQTLLSLTVFLSVLFIMAYRTQTVFINPILAIAGYMLIDCTFKRAEKETQAMVITRVPISIGDSCQLERLSHYLYIAAQPEPKQSGG